MGYTWTIKYLKYHKDIKKNWAVIIWETQTILVDAKATKEIQAEALFHEFIHIVDHYHLSLMKIKLVLAEEDTCRISSGLYQIIAGNKDVLLPRLFGP